MNSYQEPVEANHEASSKPTTLDDSGLPRSRRVRLLLITDTDLLASGGSERFLNNLLDGLDAEHFSADVIQLDRSANSPTRPLRVNGAHVNVEYRPVGPVYSHRFWLVWRELRQRVMLGTYDIIQSQHEKADVLCALLSGGPNRPLRISNRRDTGFQKSRSVRRLFRLLNRRYDRIIAPAQAILDQLVNHERVDAGRTQCMPNGVDCLRFRPVKPAARLPGRVQYGLPVDGYLFGCVARMEPVKRHEDLLAGFALAARDWPDAGLILVGNGALRGAVEQQISALGISRQVRLFDQGQQMHELLPLLDAFVLTSSTEGMSNAILEAMACGLPTIATEVGGNPELVDPGETGYLVPPFAPEALASAMSDLLAQPDKGREMGRQARLRAEEKFSVEAMVRAFTNLYQDRQAVAR
ncbi:MAG: glycosyltransferase family 4 protein [Wenzhouxiangella sp.]